MAVKYWYKALNGSGNFNSATDWYTTSGGIAGGGILTTAPTVADDVILDASSGSGTLTINITTACKSLNASTFNGTLAGTVPLNITNTGTGTILSLGGTHNYTGTISFLGSSSGNVSFNGKTHGGVITLNTTAGTLTCTDTFTCTSTFNHTAGSIAGSTLSVGNFTSASPTSKSFIFTDLYLTGTGTVLSIAAANQVSLSWFLTNIYITNNTATAKTIVTNGGVGANNIYLAGSGSGTITYTNTVGGTYTPNVYVTNSGGASIAFGASTINNLEFVTGTTANYNSSNSSLIIAGNLTFCSSCSVTAVNAITMGGTGNVTMSTKIIPNTNAVFIINTSGTITFIDTFASIAIQTNQLAITSGTAIFNSDINLSGGLLLTAGTLTTNGNVTCSGFSSTNTNIRTLNMGNGLWSITGITIPWNCLTPTNMTLNAQGSTIKFTDTVIGALTLTSLGGLTYNNIWIDRPSSGGFTITLGGSTIANFKITPPNAATSLTIPQGNTINFGEFNVNGSPGALITISRTGGNQSFFNKITPGIVSCNYLGGSTVNTIQDNTWYAGPYSTGSFVTFWKLTTPTQRMLGSLGAG